MDNIVIHGTSIMKHTTCCHIEKYAASAVLRDSEMHDDASFPRARDIDSVTHDDKWDEWGIDRTFIFEYVYF